VLFLFSVYSFEVFVPSNIPFLIFFSLQFFFLFHFIVFLSPLCCNSWPSSQYCFLFFTFSHSLSLFYSYRASQHISSPGFLPSAFIFFTPLPLSALAYSFLVQSYKLVIPSFCPSPLSLQRRTQDGGCQAAGSLPKPQNRN
jgi:hypothetical protein